MAIDGPELMIEMGLPEAARWQKALLKKPPTLAEKLGVSSQDPAYVSGAYEDAPLQDALADATVNEPQQASILIAVLTEVPDLEAASNLALAHPDKHVWMINPKGKAATVGDTMIRTHMRGRGFIDSKTSAVSDQLTATRYRLRAK
ncbi:hypothetical protein [Yoonia maricola]|uniref:hypothetical protein n=1 Tax=Yoonia maricola TaxID=420999 RepID=UPI001455A566|nr:hypothetical protein [Yoonia maricola]